MTLDSYSTNLLIKCSYTCMQSFSTCSYLKTIGSKNSIETYHTASFIADFSFNLYIYIYIYTHIYIAIIISERTAQLSGTQTVCTRV